VCAKRNIHPAPPAFFAKCSCLYPAAAHAYMNSPRHPNHSSSYTCTWCVFAEIILKLCTTMQIENCSSVTERISPLTMSAETFPNIRGVSQISSPPHRHTLHVAQIHLRITQRPEHAVEKSTLMAHPLPNSRMRVQFLSICSFDWISDLNTRVVLMQVS
jgi:hypothetical protein